MVIQLALQGVLDHHLGTYEIRARTDNRLWGHSG
jgi:hypothetical protein